MKPSKEYLDSISKKLDSFNRINGFNPKNKQEDIDSSMITDPFSQLGITAQKYLNSKDHSKVEPDPLFTDHNYK